MTFVKITNREGRVGFAAAVPVRDYYRVHEYVDHDTREAWSLHKLNNVPVKFMVGYSEAFAIAQFEEVEPFYLGHMDFDGEKCVGDHDVMIAGAKKLANPGWLHCSGVVEWEVWLCHSRTIGSNSYPTTQVAYVSRRDDGKLHLVQPA